MSVHRDQLEAWLKTIAVRSGSCLDVGGVEKPVGNRLAQLAPDRYAILDHEGGDYQVDLNEFHPPQELFALEPAQNWDTIFCLEVFEYVWNPVVAMQNLYHWLAPSGTLYISFTWQYPLHAPEGIDYLRYSENWIRKVANRVGFKGISLDARRATEYGSVQDFWAGQGMHPLRNSSEHNVTGYLVTLQK